MIIKFEQNGRQNFKGDVTIWNDTKLGLLLLSLRLIFSDFKATGFGGKWESCVHYKIQIVNFSLSSLIIIIFRGRRRDQCERNNRGFYRFTP